MTDVPRWHISGDLLDMCKCNTPCPCAFAQTPTYGDCEGLLAFHINEGQFGETPLNGLNVLALASFEGNLWAGQGKNFKMGVLLDEGADEQQRGALQAIFGGQAGGPMVRFVEMWGQPEIAGVEFAPIDVEVADDLSSWRAEASGKVETRAEALTGPTSPSGQPAQTFNVPGTVGTSEGPATWAVTTRDHVNALGFSWDWDGRSGWHIPFDWGGP